MDQDSKPVAGEELDLEEWAAQMLKRIGWHESNWKQIEIYANMPPAKKIAIMFRMRRMQMDILKARLRREHPQATDGEIARMVQEHLDLVRESVTGG